MLQRRFTASLLMFGMAAACGGKKAPPGPAEASIARDSRELLQACDQQTGPSNQPQQSTGDGYHWGSGAHALLLNAGTMALAGTVPMESNGTDTGGVRLALDMELFPVANGGFLLEAADRSRSPFTVKGAGQPATSDRYDRTKVVASGNGYLVQDKLGNAMKFEPKSWTGYSGAHCDTDTPAGPPAGTLIGCFADWEPRAMPHWAWESGDMTVEMCLELCEDADYAYAGLQAGQFCFCGNGYDTYGEQPAADCSTPCTGDSGTMCGGSWRNSVYAVGAAPPPPPTTPETLGCFADWEPRAMPHWAWESGDMTVEMCLELCEDAEYAYAGLQAGQFCFCGNDYDTYGEQPAADCNTPCAGDSGTMCGGPWRNSVYAVGAAPPPPPAAGELIGCFVDGDNPRDLPHAMWQDAGMTVDLCIEHCDTEGYDYAGVNYGTYCFCGDSYGNLGEADAADCSSSCGGGGDGPCGGFWRNSVYAVEGGGEEPGDCTPTPISQPTQWTRYLLTEIRGKDGSVTTINRDATGRVSTVVSPHGQTISTLTWSTTDGTLTTVVDPDNRTTELEYDELGGIPKLTAINEPGTNLNPVLPTQLAWLDPRKLESRTNADGVKITYTYSGDRLTAISSGDYAVAFTKVSATEYLKVVFVAGQAGDTTRYTFDPETCWLQHVDRAVGPSGTGVRTTLTWAKPGENGAGRLKGVKDWRTGFETATVFNASGDPVSSEDSDGNVASFTVDSATGNLMSTTVTPVNGSSRRTDFTYTSSNLLATKTDGQTYWTWEWTYDSANRPLLAKRNGKTLTSWTYTIGAQPWIVTKVVVTRWPGEQEELLFDANGNLTQRTDHMGRKTVITPSAGGRTMALANSVNNYAVSSMQIHRNFADHDIPSAMQMTIQDQYGGTGHEYQESYSLGTHSWQVHTNFDGKYLGQGGPIYPLGNQSVAPTRASGDNTMASPFGQTWNRSLGTGN